MGRANLTTQHTTQHVICDARPRHDTWFHSYILSNCSSLWRICEKHATFTHWSKIKAHFHASIKNQGSFSRIDQKSRLIFTHRSKIKAHFHILSPGTTCATTITATYELCLRGIAWNNMAFTVCLRSSEFGFSAYMCISMCICKERKAASVQRGASKQGTSSPYS